MITIFSILMCLAATTDRAVCDIATATDVAIVKHDQLASRLGGDVALRTGTDIRGFSLTLESSAALYMWQRPPRRPCGSADSSRCLGLMHVEVDGPLERKQVGAVMIGRQGVALGLRLHRRTVNWHRWEGGDALFPKLCGGDDYDPSCYMQDGHWRGIGAWQNTAFQVGLSRWGASVKAWHVLGRYLQRSLPWPTWGVNAQMGRGWWHVAVEASGGGSQGREARVETSYRRGRLLLAVHGGWIAPPVPGPAPFVGGLSLRLGGPSNR